MKPSPTSILQDGKVKPGVYKIRNTVSQSYVDINDQTRALVGRPSSALETSRGQWEILPLGPGYTIRKAEPIVPGKPDQFCMMLEGMGNGSTVVVSDFPVAWRIAVVVDDKYKEYEYVRIFWGTTNMVWDLAQWGSARDGTRIQVMENTHPEQCRIWELVLVKPEDHPPQLYQSLGTQSSGPSTLYPYDERRGKQCCTCSHATTEPNDDGYGTTITEVLTVTTRKKYRVEDQERV